MTPNPTIPTQADIAAAIHAVLTDDLHVQAALGSPARCYDRVPEHPLHPYVSYGRMRTEDLSADDHRREVTTVTLHLRSRYGGKAEVMGILAIVTQALSRERLRERLPGVLSVISRYADTFTARDGHSRHSILRLAITVGELEAA